MSIERKNSPGHVLSLAPTVDGPGSQFIHHVRHMSDDSRYARQHRFTPIGVAGQRRLGQATATVVGCGALGAVAAEQLVRAGVGTVRLIDRDFIEPSNLQRQSLYTEADAAAILPKAMAAAAHLRAINADVIVEPIVDEVRVTNVVSLLASSTVVIDGTDNFPTRHLINEACVQQGIPWIYGACVGAYGISLPILPRQTPCLRCIQEELPSAGESPTCDSVGIIAPAVHLVAAWQVSEAFKIMVGDLTAVRRELWTCEVWENRMQHVDVSRWRDTSCSVCGPTPHFPALSALEDPAVVLCGRNAVQIRRVIGDLAQVRQQLGDRVQLANDYLVRWCCDGITATYFRDGRIIVQGVADGTQARTFCDRMFG